MKTFGFRPGSSGPDWGSALLQPATEMITQQALVHPLAVALPWLWSLGPAAVSMLMLMLP